jgi:dolichol-phosphate mannosyltransferase
MDADGSHNPQVVPELWRSRDKAEIVIGSRYVKGGATENPAVLILMSRILNYAYQIAFRLPASDVSNSLRLYRGQQLRSLHLVSNNFDIVEEILIRLVSGRTHSTVLEIPMTFEQRKAGESKRNLPAFMLSYLSSMRRMQRFRREELARQNSGRSE